MPSKKIPLLKKKKNGVRCSENSRRCYPMGKSVVREAHRAVRAVTTYIQDNGLLQLTSRIKFLIQLSSLFRVTSSCFSRVFNG